MSASDRWRAGAGGLLLVLAACSGGATDPGASKAYTSLTFTFTGLRALDPTTEGAYAAWVSDGGQFRRLAQFDYASTVTLPLAQTLHDGAELWITLQPPGDHGTTISAQRLLRGVLHAGTTSLTVVGALTQGTLTLRDRPGQFTMFSPSDNALNGYPSHEESGIWLFNMRPELTDQKDMWVRLTQLDPGWTYEGWMVRDIGTANAVWLSYGKFTPDYTGAVNTRDNTGWGPYSGVVDFRTDGEEEFPGDDWISNPLNFALPNGLTLPLNLRETDSAGAFRWTHVITIEPAWNEDEAIGTERPFLVRPYQDPFGGGAPGAARTITLHADGVPSARVTAQ
jgi:hypothetical protein